MENKYILFVMCRSLYLEKSRQISAAKNLGYKVLIADASKSSYGNVEYDDFIETDLSEEATAAKEIINYINKSNIDVAGVITWMDVGVSIVSIITNELGLPGTPESVTKNVKNKIQTREILSSIPHANPKYCIVDNVKDINQAVEKLSVPCVVKYPTASGGRGIFGVSKDLSKYEDLEGTIQSFCVPENDKVFKNSTGLYLVEEKLSGTEHSVAGVIYEGKITSFAISDKSIDIDIPYQYMNTVPSALSEKNKNMMIEIARSSIQASGIDNCGFHVDFIVNENGPYVLEIGGRFGGECINSHLISNVLGDIDPYEIAIGISTGKNPELQFDYSKHAEKAASLLTLYTKNFGVIESIDGLTEIKNKPSVVEFLQVRNIGDDTFHPLEKYNSLAIAHVIVVEDNLETLSKTIEDIKGLFAVKIHTAN